MHRARFLHNCADKEVNYTFSLINECIRYSCGTEKSGKTVHSKRTISDN